MTIKTELWGKLKDGREVFRFELQNRNGISAAIINYGGTIQQILTPDRNGNLADIVLGYETPSEYEQNDGCFGATIGRVANRIAGAAFELDGNTYSLTANKGANTLHGGSGFHTKLWDYEVKEDALVLKYTSPDGEDGFPGTLQAEQTITLSEDNVLRLEYRATCDKTTLCSLTGHSYFNLAGVDMVPDNLETKKTEGIEGKENQHHFEQAQGCNQHVTADRMMAQSVARHQIQIAANEYTPVGEDLIPTGEILPVLGTPYDFLSARAVGEEQLDGNLVLSKAFRKWDVRVLEPVSGRFLSIRTSLPGIQLYNGSGITLREGKGGVQYGPQSGLALEPQFYPDAIHHPDFPQPILKAGETYQHYIEYRFGVL